MKQLVRSALAAATTVAVMATAGTVSAATITLLGDSEQGATNTAGLDFALGYGAFVPVGATPSDLNVRSTNEPGLSQSPFNSNALTDQSTYFTAQEGTPGKLTYSTGQTSFTFLWGSIDTYNTLSFNNGVSYTGTEIIDMFMLGGTGPQFEQVALLEFSDFASAFTEVTFISDGAQAFEFAMASEVPLPAGALLLISGMGAFGVARRMKKAS